MDPSTTCPAADALRQLLLGLGDPALSRELEEHVSACEACAERASRVVAEDDLVRSLKRAGMPDDTPPPEVVGPLVSVFKHLRHGPDSGATAAWVGVSAPSGGSVRGEPAGGPGEPEEVGRFGPYVLHAVLGMGGMGVVYRAYDPALRRSVALKVIRPDLLAAPGAVERFLAEARAAAAVEHDNIVVVHSVSVHDGVPCIVMPLLKGETLEQRLQSATGPLPAASVLRVAGEAAAGLAAAHERGLIHRDIKPGNLWLEAPAGRLKVLDFGLAVAAGGESGFGGTPGYMAPEQIAGRDIDPRADLFSLGCVLYRAATGAAPFAGPNPTAVLVQTVTRDPEPTAARSPAVPPRLARLIDRLLAKEPGGRPASAAEVVAELAAIGAEAEARRRRVTRRRWLLGVTAAGVASGLGVWLWGRPAPVLVAAPEEPPVRVAFVTDPDVGKVVFTRDGVEQTFDLSGDAAVSLAPGSYLVRPAVEVPGRRLEPAVVAVTAGEPKPVKLALVGEVVGSKAHGREVRGVAVVPGKDRFTALTASRDRTLGAWDPAAKGEPRFARLEYEADCLAVTPDGSVAVTAGGVKGQPRNPVQLWDGRTLEPRGEPLDGHTRRVAAVAVSADGKRAVSAATGELWLWDVEKRTRVNLDGHGDEKVFAAAFGPDGKQALTGDEVGKLIVWDVVEAKPVKKLIGQSAGEVGGVRAVAFAPTGFVSVGDDGLVRVWDAATFKARELPPTGKPLLALAVSKDGKRFLTGGEDGSVRLWSAATGAVAYTFAGHRGPVYGVAFTPDGRGAVSCGADQTVRLWRLPFE